MLAQSSTDLQVISFAERIESFRFLRLYFIRAESGGGRGSASLTMSQPIELLANIGTPSFLTSVDHSRERTIYYLNLRARELNAVDSRRVYSWSAT